MGKQRVKVTKDHGNDTGRELPTVDEYAPNIGLIDVPDSLSPQMLGGADEPSLSDSLVKADAELVPSARARRGRFAYWLLRAFAFGVDAYGEYRGMVALDALVIAALATIWGGGASTASLSFLPLCILLAPLVPAAVDAILQFRSLRKHAETIETTQEVLKEQKTQLKELHQENKRVRRENESADLQCQALEKEIEIHKRQLKETKNHISLPNAKQDVLVTWLEIKGHAAESVTEPVSTEPEPTEAKRETGVIAFIERSFARVLRVLLGLVPNWCHRLYHNEQVGRVCRSVWQGLFTVRVLALTVFSTLSLVGVGLSLPIVIGVLSASAAVAGVLSITEYYFGHGNTLEKLKEAKARREAAIQVEKENKTRYGHVARFRGARKALYERKLARRQAKKRYLEFYGTCENKKTFKEWVDVSTYSVAADNDAQTSCVIEEDEPAAGDIDIMQGASDEDKSFYHIVGCVDETEKANDPGEKIRSSHQYSFLESLLLTVSLSGIALVVFEGLQSKTALYWIAKGLGFIGVSVTSIVTMPVVVGSLVTAGLIIAMVAIGMYVWTECQQKKTVRLQQETMVMRSEFESCKNKVENISRSIVLITKAVREQIDALEGLNADLSKAAQCEGKPCDLLTPWLYAQEDLDAYRAQLLDKTYVDGRPPKYMLATMIHSMTFYKQAAAGDVPKDVVDDTQAESRGRRRFYMVREFFHGLVTPLGIGLGICAVFSIPFTGVAVVATVVTAMIVASLHVYVAHRWGYDSERAAEAAQTAHTETKNALDRMNVHHEEMVRHLDAAEKFQVSIERKVTKLKGRLQCYSDCKGFFHQLPRPVERQQHGRAVMRQVNPPVAARR